MALYTISITDGTTLSSLAVSAGRGPKGDGFTGGSYNASTGVVTFTSNDGLGFSTEDLRGDLSEPGPIGDVTPNTGAFTEFSTTGNAVIGGDLTVQGTTTTVDSTTVAVADKNIELAKDATTAAEADGGGITLVGADATITYSSVNDIWNLNKGLNVSGNVTLSGTVDGRDISADGSKLDGIEDGADITDTTNVTAAGALMDSELTDIAAVKGLDQGVATTDSPSFAGLTVDTDTLYVDSANKRVGIGTTSPDEPLVVTGDVKLTGASDLHFTNTSGFVGIGAPASSILRLKSNAASGRIEFQTSGSEAMRIDSSGNVLVGQSASAIPGADNTTIGIGLNSIGLGCFSRSGAAAGTFNRNTSDGSVVVFYRQGSSVGGISVSTTATSYNTSSDERLKENITDAQDASAVIDGIQVRQFDWKADGEHQRYGMVAQELDTVAPEAVTKGETEDDMWAVDYSKLVPMLVKEIQDLRKRVAELEGETQ